MIQQIIAALVKSISTKINSSIAVINNQIIKLSIKIEDVRSELSTTTHNYVLELKETDKNLTNKIDNISKKVDFSIDLEGRVKQIENVIANDDKSLDTIREIADRIKDDANSLKTFRDATNRSINYIMPEEFRSLSEEQWNSLIAKMVDDNWVNN